MGRPLVVIGAGGFGRETLDVVDAVNAAADAPVFDVLGVLDDAPSQVNLDRLAARGVAFLGTLDDAQVDLPTVAYCIGIGSPRARRTVAERLDAAGAHPVTVIHPDATCGSQVELGVGAVICAGARIGTNVSTGRHLSVNANVTVGHDTVLGNFVSLNPLAAVSGDCTIEDDVLIGVAGVILNGLTVGRGATVGGSACVVHDVPAGSTVKGVPAR